jgi:hypothetical protein
MASQNVPTHIWGCLLCSVPPWQWWDTKVGMMEHLRTVHQESEITSQNSSVRDYPAEAVKAYDEADKRFKKEWNEWVAAK